VAAAFAIYSLATGPIVGRYGAPAATAWSALIGLLVVAPVAIPDAVHQPWLDLSGGPWLSLFYASAISMLLAFSIWAWAIARQGVGRTVPYLFLIPVVTGILAALFLGKQFGHPKISGGLLVLLGTALVRLQGRRAPEVRSQKSEFRGDDEDGRGPLAREPSLRR
jgi:drug/metabolite transporter (DMT)-like permease